MKRLLSALLVALLPAVAMAQQTVQQGGSFAAGRVPTYSGSSGAPIVQSAGSAGGGGVGIAELPIIARGTGLPPFASQGSGPLGTIFTLYDGPTNAAAGYHYLALSANAQGGGLLAYGSGGGASALPLTFTVNGASYQFPFSTSGILGPNVSIIGDVACWNNTNGTLLKDCGANLLLQGVSSGSLTLRAPATASGILTLPNGTDTIVARASTDTLTNKTLTTPTINGGTMNSPTIVTPTISSPTITSPTITNATINTATITSASLGSLSTAATQAAGDNTTLVATDAFVQNAVSTGMPVGACVPYAGATAPTNWVLGFGQAISRTTFAAAFAVYGTTYGPGDGSTTFNMPDLRGRAAFGADAMGGSPASRLGSGATGGVTGAATPGATGGQQSHVQTVAELASHAHSYPGQVLTYLNVGIGGVYVAQAGVDVPIYRMSETISSTGGSNAANITPPVLVMNYICKTN